jgi:translation initiation factor 1A
MNNEACLLKAYGEPPDTLGFSEGIDIDGPEDGDEENNYI